LNVSGHDKRFDLADGRSTLCLGIPGAREYGKRGYNEQFKGFHGNSEVAE
jgi:hypothetical protein